MELVIFAAFVTLQFIVKQLPQWFGRISHIAIVQRLSRNHWIVYLANPIVWHSAHDYAVHFVVYSGYVISSHH